MTMRIPSIFNIPYMICLVIVQNKSVRMSLLNLLLLLGNKGNEINPINLCWPMMLAFSLLFPFQSFTCELQV